MKVLKRTLAVGLSLVVLAPIPLQLEAAVIPESVAPAKHEPTKVITFKPPYGFYARPIKIRLSKSELDIVRRLQVQSHAPPNLGDITRIPIVWKLEKGVKNAETFQLGRNALFSAEELLGRPGDVDPYPITIIVGRTQSYIRSQIAALGCRPNLTSTNGQYLMGAALCNRRVIVMNLTGYYFLKFYGQRITSAMETRPDPSVAQTSYRVVGRNIGSLSHEWTHVVRALPSEGIISFTEPAWLSEGMAEVVSGMSMVRASEGKFRYRDFHVIRLRKFSVWPSSCPLSLTRYRKISKTLGGCEYMRGAAAVEHLLANYGGLRKLMNLYNDAHLTDDFFLSFQKTYGMTLRSFERKADIYAKSISHAATYASK